MAKMGRPQKEIDKDQFEKLCYLQCTLLEIASFFNCSDDTIENWCKRTYSDEAGNPMTFSEVYKIHSAGGKISIRRWQFKMAEHNPGMAMFLGKVLLGQRETVDVSVEARQSADVEALNEYFRQRNQERNT